MYHFTGHEGTDTVVVRGSMHHTVMMTNEFEEWLEYEDCTRSPWRHLGGTHTESCLIYRPDGSVRSMAVKIHTEFFEAVEV
jgi:hypothetical protein